jgi:hypothetical protein
MYLEDVEKVAMEDGIVLHGVPRTATAKALIRAGSAAREGKYSGAGGRPSRQTVA